MPPQPDEHKWNFKKLMTHPKGLTMLELVIVTAIIALLAAVAYPQLRPKEVAGAAGMMHGDLEYARSLAINNKNKVRVIFDVPGGDGGASSRRYKIHDDTNGDGAIDPGEDTMTRSLQQDYEGVSFSTNRKAAVFNPQGTSNSGTVTVTNGSDSKRIVFSWTGRIRITDGPSS